MKTKLDTETKAELYLDTQTTSDAPVPPHARLHTQEVREGLDDLDRRDRLGYTAGPEQFNDDLGWDDIDDADGDLMVDESDEPDSHDPQWIGDEEQDVAPPEDGRLPTLEDVIGSRNPAVLIRLDRLNANMVVGQIVRTSAEVTEALNWIRLVAQNAFNQGRQRFDDVEWEQLLGSQPASPQRRLALLARLHVDRAVQARIAQDHSLPRYDKFAVLPDGTAFSIQLLFRDRRGRPARTGTESGEHGFDQLPEAIKFDVYRSVLDDERAGRLRDEKGKALQDADVFREMVKRLQEDSLLEDPPHPGRWAGTLRNYRNRFRQGRLSKNLQQYDLGHLALNYRDRNRLYAELRPTTNSKEQGS